MIISNTLESYRSVIQKKNQEIVYVFSPELGDFELKYTKREDYPFLLKIPFELNHKELYLDNDLCKKLAILSGFGSKHFDKLLDHNQYEKIVELLNQLLQSNEGYFNILTDGQGNEFIYDISKDKTVVDFDIILNSIRNFVIMLKEFKKLDCNFDNNEVDKYIRVPFFVCDGSKIILGISCEGSLLSKEFSCGALIQSDKIGNMPTTILPCIFSNKTNNENLNELMLFDIKKLTNTKPKINFENSPTGDIHELLCEYEDFYEDNIDLLSFKENVYLNDSEHYLKHLIEETRLPKKFIKKGLISGNTSRMIVDSILGLTQQQEIYENKKLYNKLIRAAGYACYYQKNICKNCMRTEQLDSEN